MACVCRHAWCFACIYKNCFIYLFESLLELIKCLQETPTYATDLNLDSDTYQLIGFYWCHITDEIPKLSIHSVEQVDWSARILFERMVFFAYYLLQDSCENAGWRCGGGWRSQNQLMLNGRVPAWFMGLTSEACVRAHIPTQYYRYLCTLYGQAMSLV